MIPVAPDHAANVVDRNILPGLVADVLPPRNFLQHEQSNFVARIQKVPRLWKRRRPNNVALDFRTKKVRTPPLHPPRHRLSNERESLVPIQSAQLDNLAVEREPLVGKLRVPKAYNARNAVDLLTPPPQRYLNPVQIRMRQIPKFDSAQVCQRNSVYGRFADSRRNRNILRAFSHHSIALAQHNFQSQRFSRRFKMLNMTIDINAGMIR